MIAILVAVVRLVLIYKGILSDWLSRSNDPESSIETSKQQEKLLSRTEEAREMIRINPYTYYRQGQPSGIVQRSITTKK